MTTVSIHFRSWRRSPVTTASLSATAASSSPRASGWWPCPSTSSGRSATPSWRASGAASAATSRYTEQRRERGDGFLTPGVLVSDAVEGNKRCAVLTQLLNVVQQHAGYWFVSFTSTGARHFQEQRNRRHSCFATSNLAGSLRTTAEKGCVLLTLSAFSSCIEILITIFSINSHLFFLRPVSLHISQIN